MLLLRRLSSVLLVGAVLAVSSCDTPTEPPASQAEVEQLGLLSGVLKPVQPVSVLKRTVSLESDISVTRVIGWSGGVIEIPEAGLRVSIPSRAITGPTEITVTAPAGDLMGYHFAPHGLEFARSVTVRQDLSNTDAALLSSLLSGLSAAYFQGDLKPKVLALEILDLSLIGRLLAQFEIDHFSGYVIATD